MFRRAAWIATSLFFLAGTTYAGPCEMLSGAEDRGNRSLGDLIPEILSIESTEISRACTKKALALKRSLLPSSLKSAKPFRPKIVDRPIPWSDSREKLLREYLEMHTGDGSTEIRHPAAVVVHWTETPTADAAYEIFAAPKLRGRPSLSSAGNANVGCQFLIDRDGTIFQLMPETRIARHTVGMNRAALCIENVGGPLRLLTSAQLKSNSLLIRSLVSRYPSIESVLGHAEYRSFERTYLFSETDPNYRSDRVDEPGADFLRRLRADFARSP